MEKCSSEAKQVAVLAGVGEEEALGLLCRLGVLAATMLKPVVDKLEASLDSVEVFELDPEGPRVVLKLKGVGRVVEAYVDMSPDGVELTASIAVGRGYERALVEDAVADTVEGMEAFAAVDEYDVSYDPDEGVLSLTLTARLLAELPGLATIVDAVERAMARL